MAQKRDYYEILELSKDASPDDVTKAFRRLAMKYHPDRNSGDKEAEMLFREVAEAHEVLRDPDKRRTYDRYGHAGLQSAGVDFGGMDLSDILGRAFGGLRDFFSGAFGGPRTGEHLRVDFELDLVKAARGAKATLTVPGLEVCSKCKGDGKEPGTKQQQCRTCGGRGQFAHQVQGFSFVQACPSCGGRGSTIDACRHCRGHGKTETKRQIEVDVPAGVVTGDRMRLRGEGLPGDPGEPPGDLVCIFHVVDAPPFYLAENQNIVCRIPITISQAALGAEVEVPTLEGPQKVKFERGVQHGEVIKILPGKGQPNRRGQRGDLMIQALVETPTNLTTRQEELLRELATLDEKNVSPQRKGWFEKLKSFFR